MEKNIVVGIIGAGMIAEKHIVGLQKTGRAKVKWVARENGEKLKSFQEKYSIPFGTTDYRDILADSEVDAVVITAPPAFHYAMFVDAVNAGKHILLEKPAAVSKSHVDSMVALAAEHPELLISDCSSRHARLQPKFKIVKSIIDSGKLGEIYFIHHNAVARQSRPGIEYHPSAKWFLNKNIAGGGVLFDWGVYDLSFHLGVLGDVPQLEKSDLLFMKNGLDNVDPGTDIFDVEEHFAVSMQFSGGLRYYWEHATNANMEATNETRIYGTRGGIKLSFCSWENPDIELFDVEDQGRGKARKELIHVDLQGHDDNDALSQHFVNALLGEEKIEMPLSLAAKHLDIIFGIYDKS